VIQYVCQLDLSLDIFYRKLKTYLIVRGTREVGLMRFCDAFSLFAVARPSVCLSSVVCPSVVCNARAPYSGASNFRQYFYGVRYLGHPLTFTENFTEIVPGEPLRRGS